MPIPDNIKMRDCIGRYATLDRSVENGAGHGIAKGSKVKIISYSRSLTVRTDPCEHCGQFTKIRGVTKAELTLLSAPVKSTDVKEKAMGEKRDAWIPEDIIKTEEYGWVKLLPIGPGETVYSWEIDYVGMNNQPCRVKATADQKPAMWYYTIGEKSSEWKPPEIYIFKTTMKVSFYSSFGRLVFATQEEAKAGIKAWLEKSFENGVNGKWIINEYTEEGEDE